jgi:2-hydroxychromene-2-carboxylate isomerase
MASRRLALLSMAPFDFSRWSGESKPEPKFHDLALTAEQVESILATKHGVSELLFQEFERDTKRSGIPHAFMKALIVFEEYGRDTTYQALAAALDVKVDTAKEYMREAREAVRTALGVEMISAGDTVRLVIAHDAREKAIRVLNVFEQHVEPALKKLQACTKSLAASNVPLTLPARAMAILEASKVEDVA